MMEKCPKCKSYGSLLPIGGGRGGRYMCVSCGREVKEEIDPPRPSNGKEKDAPR